jgi:type II secretory pathway pseudopilin PulG
MLEIGIALAILGLMMAIAIPSVNAISGAELKKTTGMLQGLLRDTYARAAISGNSHRVVFDLEAHAYWVEVSEGGVVMPREKLEPTREGAGVLDKVDERIENIEADTDDEEDQERLRLYKGPSWTPVPAPGQDRVDEVRPQKLPSDVYFKSVWVDHLSEAVTGGQTSITFFPGGYTQEAHITVTDDEDGDRTLTLVTQALTGEVFVDREEPELPRGY